MPVVLLVKDDAELLERVTVETLASFIPHARIATLPPGTKDQPASGSEWIDAIAEVLEVRAADRALPGCRYQTGEYRSSQVMIPKGALNMLRKTPHNTRDP